MTAKSNYKIIQPNFFFDGNCEQAVQFYRTTSDMQVHSSSSFIPGNNFARAGIFTRLVRYVWM